MKTLIVLVALPLTLLLLATGCQQRPATKLEGRIPQDGRATATAGTIQVTATINGLEKGEEATLTISHEGSAASEELFFKRNVTSGGEKEMEFEITANLTDGYYQLLLEAPDKYFREPKGYFFMVNQSRIVNPSGRDVVFNLLPQPVNPVAEAYLSLSAPAKQPMYTPPIVSRVFPEESHYLPGKQIELKLAFTNASPEPVTLDYLPSIYVAKHLNPGQILYSQVGTEQRVDVKPDATVTTVFTWDQKDLAGQQVPPGWYDITWKDPAISDGTDKKIGSGLPAMVLIEYPQGAMEKTIGVNESRTVNDITITLERIELTAKGTMVYAFGTLPNYPPRLDYSPFVRSSSEYSVDGRAAGTLSHSGMKYLENGTRFIWGGTRPIGTLDPIPIDSQNLVFRINTITLSSAPGQPEELIAGPWEFKVALH